MATVVRNELIVPGTPVDTDDGVKRFDELSDGARCELLGEENEELSDAYDEQCNTIAMMQEALDNILTIVKKAGAR
jgi:hypothetical protein